MIAFLRQLLALAKPYKGRLALGILFGFLSGLTNPLLMIAIKLVTTVVFPSADGRTLEEQLRSAPAFMRAVVEQAGAWIPRADSASRAAMVVVIASIPLIMLLRGLCSYLNIYFMQWVAVRAVTDLRTKLFGHLMNLSLSFFHESKTGELMSRISNDTGAILSCVSNSLSVLIKEPVTLVGLAALLIWQQPKLTLISLLIFPICLWPILIYARKARQASAALQEYAAQVGNVMHEAFTGNRIIKAYNLESAVEKQFRDASQKGIGQFMRMIRSLEIPGPLIEFVGALSVGLIFLYIGLGTKTPMLAGDFLQFVGCIFLMYQPIKALTRLYHQLEQARAGSRRVFELLELRPTVIEVAEPLPLHAAGTDIHFDHVHFGYGEKPVLRDIHLTIQSGQLVALVGSSGSGKTTLTNLLLRFYDPQQGAVRIGDTDIRKVTLGDLRNNIAVVTQESILFNDTIRNNIALGRAGATDVEIEEAAKHAHAHEFIIEKPQGYDTIIGEKGITLSGGQRQRLAIARAILRNAPILILDEATSALDTESERIVQAALERLMEHRTTLCIAHRLSTIQNADLIVVLVQGRIVETGSHAALIQQGGVYQKLYEL